MIIDEEGSKVDLTLQLEADNKNISVISNEPFQSSQSYYMIKNGVR